MSLNVAYINSIWSQAYGALSWFTSQTYSNQAEVALQTSNLFQTFSNGADTLSALQMINALSSLSISLQQIEALPISIGNASQALTTRVNELNLLISGLSGILPNFPSSSASQLLNAAQPALPSGNYLSFLNSFSGDSYISGMAQNISDWQTISSNLIAYYGNNPTQLLDISNFTITASQAQSGILASLGLNSPASGSAFTQYYSLPVCLALSSFQNAGFAYYINQQCLVIKNLLRALAGDISQTLLAALSPSPQSQISTTSVYGNESLQDVANRVLGNFEQWESIGQINAILPGTTPPAGTQIVLPPTSLVSGASGFSYNINVLGQDINIGPTSGTMPTWTGDFQTISGPNNLIYALARRILTTLGSFIYHPNYGSRIPPEIGSVQSVGSLQHIAAFLKSALSSDPRVASIINSSVSGSSSFGLISAQAVIQPIGPQSIPVEVNEVISPY